MARFSELLHGSVRVRITGAAPESCLNAFTEAGIAWWDALSEDEFTLKAGLAARDLARAKAAAGRSQCEINVLKELGAPAVRRKLRRRIALLSAAVLCFSALALSSLYVWDVDVEGNESVPESEILLALAESGVKSGAFWPGWDADAIKNEVILAVPELSWIGVSVSGSRAEVRVRERIAKPEVVSGAAGSVAARATGIIERMEVYQGAPLVSVGDAVAEGETLVSGKMPSETGDTRYVRASAEITAHTWRELTASAPLEYTKLTESGSHTRWALEIGEKRVNFYRGSSQTPEGCGKITTEYPLAWEGVFTLPVTLVRERIIEYEPSKAAEDSAALQERLAGELRSELERALDGKGECINATFTAAEHNGRLVVTMRAECREDIAVFVPAE